MESIWIKTAKRPRFEPLSGSTKTDVLIIGGGMAGLLCAYMLDRAGVDYLLVEADRICGDVTQNTTAKLTLQHGLRYDSLLRKFGAEQARMYWQANWEALEEYRAICSTIDCDFEEQNSFVYSLHDRKRLEDEVRAIEKIGGCASLVSELPLPFPTVGAVCIEHQAQFHPLTFAFEIAKLLRVVEQTRVLELKPNEAHTNHGRISAKKILVTTHFPFLNKHGLYFLKLYQERSYVIGLQGVPRLDGMYVDEASEGLSFRYAEDLLLLGGGAHRTGKTGGGWSELIDFARRYYPNQHVTARWATQDCMTLDGVPYVGRYARGTQDLYVATGFNKWGMTSSMVAAMLLRDAILEKENPYASVFSPSRSILHRQLAINAGESLLGLLSPSTPRCPHMGCALHYNRQEHSWDCSCHGSRFTKEGKLINNPANGDKDFS